MKTITCGGGYFDADLGEMVRLPVTKAEVPDDFFEKAFQEMIANPTPEYLVVSEAFIEAFK